PLIGYLEMLARWAIAIAVLLLGRLPAGRCQGIGDRVNPPPTAPLLLQLQSTVDSLTRNIFPAVKDNFGFCIKDPCLVPWVHIAQLHNLMELQVFVIRKYEYQPPPGQPNHTCGGADIWADVDHSGDLFCPAGYYCPSTIQKNNCSSGYYSCPSHPTPSSFRLRPLVVNIHFCRMGSTYETSCYKSSTCNSNSENQSMTIFGALVMVALILLLLIIYNFSDQILSYRERRQAKSREAAARIAREAVQARERWKAAKDIAVKHAVGIQNQISRTFSRKISNKLQERYKVLGLSRQLSDASTSDIEELSILGNNNMTHSSEKISDSSESPQMDIEDTYPRKNATKGKHMHTRTRIFKDAYIEIEKEKVLQQEKKNLTFSGVISMATKNEIRTRPIIEITFKDLTLVLKRNKKQLLKSVTGKLIPGHVTAVMGPSGAGKTTFLTALAGKTSGCQMTGLVLINGKVEPIRSYKKIIGFVPQDDIVHGNLTVEENLWFSANCRYETHGIHISIHIK
ncbi:hypothetical protein B296_00027444, partial [Ensete ventricosum]